MKLVVMIPAYNEEKTIQQVIKSIPKNLADKQEILVIDDGSIDNTIKLSKEAGAVVISHAKNKGLGITFRDGIKKALDMNADIIVNIDADGQFNSQDISKLIQPIIENKADVVTCSRFLIKKYSPKMPKIKRFGNYIIAKLINFITGKKFTDTQCGFRAYSREAALRLNLFGDFTYTQEVFLDLLNKGLTIKEVPCIVLGQRKGKSRLYKNWFNYGLQVSLIILRTIRDHKPLMFFGTIGLSLFSLGFIIDLILFIRWLITQIVSPYASLISIGIFLMVVGFLLIILALLADMYSRQRKLQEEILYQLKKK